MRGGPRSGSEAAAALRTWLGAHLSVRCSLCPRLQAQSDAEALAGALDKDEGRASPCTPSTPSVCSPPSAASSVPSAGKNICSSCGLEILDRYLLKVRRARGRLPRWRRVGRSPEHLKGGARSTKFLILAQPLPDCAVLRKS